MKRIQQILEKLDALQQKDIGHSIFGSRHHEYLLNPRLREKEILSFENKYHIQIPDDYRWFIKYVGNGGAGPYFGINRIEDTILNYVAESDPNYLSKKFPLNAPLDLVDECREELSQETFWNKLKTDPAFSDHVAEQLSIYHSKDYSLGTLAICEYGCGIYFFVPISEPESGNMWVNDFASDAGIFPLTKEVNTQQRVDFWTWYENWLDASLYELDIPQVERIGGYFEFGLSQPHRNDVKNY